MRKLAQYRRNTHPNSGFKELPDEPEEDWRDINGFKGLYQVSNLGRVKSFDRMARGSNNSKRLVRGRVLKMRTDKEGYHRVNLYKNGQAFNRHVHRLVAEAFIPGSWETVDHINGVRNDNSVSNLRWASHTFNHLNRHVCVGASGTIGIQLRADRKKNPWIAHIQFRGKQEHLGGFPTKELAIQARKKRLNELFGEGEGFEKT